MSQRKQVKIERRPQSRQIADYYVGLIELGSIEDGDKLPGRSEIAYVHNVGESVAQDALVILRDTGYAVTIPRRGSYAIRPHRTSVDGC